MRKFSWILLTVLAAATLLLSLFSAATAYRGDYPIGGTRIAEVAEGRAEVLAGLRGSRGTAAAYAAGFALLNLLIVLIPYRRGEVWAWWALLLAYALLVLVVLLRVPLLGTQLGVATALTQGGVALVGLLFDVRRLRAPAA